MIVIKFSGGLGNQLYEYALYRKLKKLYPNTKIKADVSDYVLYDVHYGFELNRIFQLQQTGKLEIATFFDQIRARGEFPIVIGGKLGKRLEVPIAWMNCRMRRQRAKNGTLHVVEEPVSRQGKGRDELKEEAKRVAGELAALDLSKDWYVKGYWQTP